MEEIVVGASLPQTGPFAEEEFPQYSYGYNLWLRDVNAAGGLLGRQVRLHWYDDVGDPVRCRENYHRLIHDDKVDLLLGPVHSPLIDEMAGVAEAAQMVLLEGSGSDSDLFRKGRRWLFLCWDADCNFVKSFFEFLASSSNPKRVAKVGTIAGTRARGLHHSLGVHTYAMQFGLEVAFQEQLSPEPDFVDIFRRAKASGAEMMLCDVGGPGELKKSAVSAALSAGFAPSALWLTENPGYDVENGVYSRVMWLPNDPRPTSARFTADFRAFAGFEPDQHPAGAYACGQVLAQAVASTGTLNQADLREAILRMTFDTVLGPLRYAEDGIPIATFPIAQWQHGRREIVFPIEAKTSEAMV